MIIETENRILAMIDDMVDEGSDDQLFAGGYLRGHLTQSVAELESEGLGDTESLRLRVEESLNQAIRQQELSPPDQILVLELWQELFHKACATA